MALYNAKFGEYNQTHLVKPGDAAQGVPDWSGNKQGRGTLNAAAVLRLPFPANPDMVGWDQGSGAPLDYHSGTMEWDLDPGNEGASAGFFSFAPAYPSILTTISSSPYPNSKARYDQFVNGLTPLALPGEVSGEDRSSFLPATADKAVDLTGGAQLINSIIENRWDIPPSASAIVEMNLEPKRGSVIGRTMTRAAELLGNDVDSYGHRILDASSRGVKVVGAGLPEQLLNNPWTLDWTFPLTFLSARDVWICTFPGTALAFLQLQEVDMGITLWKELDVSGAGSDRKLCSTLCTSARMRGYYLPGDRLGNRPRIYEPSYDLIRIPMQSGSTNNAPGYGNLGSGATNLKGRRINYPPSWSPTTITNLEGSVAGSRNFYPSYGRGVYMGNEKYRFSMPVLIPGTGTPLDQASARFIPAASLEVGRIMMSDLPETGAQPPEPFPYEPSSPLFASSPRRNLPQAFGGPLAYAFYGMMISPSADQYKNRAIMQITGGPVLGFMNDVTNFSIDYDVTKPDNPNRVNGTALDAFWPSMRPILKSK
jgi:hypothetical protein